MQTTKQIKTVFSDYQTENVINQAKILELKFIKKANVIDEIPITLALVKKMLCILIGIRTLRPCSLSNADAKLVKMYDS